MLDRPGLGGIDYLIGAGEQNDGYSLAQNQGYSDWVTLDQVGSKHWRYLTLKAFFYGV
ncbi:hypothetical protein [Pseudomonas sp. MOIL14HWK12:I2]|uniref:hypothetical protein n=1 Tax=Pseudomonas sp. MOIL14HWK12:I2 TaxID=1033994 RepID=UPI0012EC5229|nr:hypothetical protein [Pseudomonas sp. MOIL14HWK12:I2]